MCIGVTTLRGEYLIVNLFAVSYIEARKEGICIVLADGDSIGVRENFDAIKAHIISCRRKFVEFTQKNGVRLLLVNTLYLAVTTACKGGTSLIFVSGESKNIAENMADVEEHLREFFSLKSPVKVPNRVENVENVESGDISEGEEKRKIS